VLSGRGLCDRLITRPEESYLLCCVVVCDLETSRIGAPYIYDISHLRVKHKVINDRKGVMKYEMYTCIWRVLWPSFPVLWFPRHNMLALVCPPWPIDFTCYIHELWHSKSHRNAGWEVYKFIFKNLKKSIKK
jgi:hypothetical protein